MDTELEVREHVHLCISLRVHPSLRHGTFVPTHMPPPGAKMVEMTGGVMHIFSLCFGDGGRFLFGEPYQTAVEM